MASLHNPPTKNFPRGSKDDKKEWAEFNASLPFDAVVPQVEALLRSIRPGVTRFMVSGRAEGDWPGDRRRRFAMEDWVVKYELPFGPAFNHEKGCDYADENLYKMQTRKALGELLQGEESERRIEKCMQALREPNQSNELASEKDGCSTERASKSRPRENEEIQKGTTTNESKDKIWNNSREIRRDVPGSGGSLQDLQTTSTEPHNLWDSSSGSLSSNKQSSRASVLQLQFQHRETGTLLECGCRIPPYNLGNFVYMRSGGDTRRDSVVKEEILLRDILPYYNPVVAVDDRPEVCEVWEKYGIYVIRVSNPGTLPPIAFQETLAR